MATAPKVRSVSNAAEATHQYHADAYVLDADLQQPLPSKIEKTGLVTLPDDGKYTYVPVKPFNLEGVL